MSTTSTGSATVRLTPIQAAALREIESAGQLGKTTTLRSYKQFTIDRLIEQGLITATEMRRSRGVPLLSYAITSLGITALANHMQERS